MNYSYRPTGVCARSISFEIEDGKVHGVSFVGGCDGNLKAVSKLVEGRSPQEVIDVLKGNLCGFKNTSCADQLAHALEQALAQKGQ